LKQNHLAAENKTGNPVFDGILPQGLSVQRRAMNGAADTDITPPFLQPSASSAPRLFAFYQRH
jgi:hypothetical protein